MWTPWVQTGYFTCKINFWKNWGLKSFLGVKNPLQKFLYRFILLGCKLSPVHFSNQKLYIFLNFTHTFKMLFWCLEASKIYNKKQYLKFRLIFYILTTKMQKLFLPENFYRHLLLFFFDETKGSITAYLAQKKFAYEVLPKN